MKVEFDEDEAWEVLSVVVTRLADEAELSDTDRAKVRRWRSEVMKPRGDGVRQFAAKLNADIAKTMERKAGSHIRKPDWRKR
jgi:hypothetical protein